jgi:hypothetical protein
MQNENQRVHLELTIDEMNLVLNALGQLPYVQVVNILNNISKQAESQFKVNENELSTQNNNHG